MAPTASSILFIAILQAVALTMASLWSASRVQNCPAVDDKVQAMSNQGERPKALRCKLQPVPAKLSSLTSLTFSDSSSMTAHSSIQQYLLTGFIHLFPPDTGRSVKLLFDVRDCHICHVHPGLDGHIARYYLELRNTFLLGPIIFAKA